MEGCARAYHVAAFAGVWAKDESIIDRLNVDATLSLLKMAMHMGIQRVVITSTAGILGPSAGPEVDEQSPPPTSFFTAYEQSKARMEEAVRQLDTGSTGVVIVNPTRVFGPGELSESNGVTRMIKQYVEGNWRLIPGSGRQPGNYVFVEDVVEGHLLAMEKGRAGERYVLGGDNISYNELFRITRKLSGKRYRLFHIPLWLMLSVAGVMETVAKLTGMAPLIVPGLVRKFNYDWRVSSSRAKAELGYRPRSAEEGIAQTLEWIRQEKTG
jgi:farnesol dehydrogenase